MMKPVLKWAGGKAKILNLIEERVDKVFDSNKQQTFYDLFSGGGSVSIRMLYKFDKVVMNDKNSDVINVYRQIKKDYKSLIDVLKIHEDKHSKKYYNKIRSLDRKKNYIKASDLEKAARTIYLNKTCFNGLYRVNSKGQFNVPIGKPLYGREIYNEDNFKKLSNALKKVTFTSKDYKQAVKNVRPYDVVYFDPPYDVETKQSFVSYTSNGFTRKDQKDLFLLFDKLTKKGVYVILSNSRTKFIEDLYKDYITKESKIDVARSISGNKKSRLSAKEILIDNFEVVNNEYNNKSKI